MVENSEKNLRECILNKRISLKSDEYENLNKKIIENLKKVEEIEKAKIILGYYPIKKEANILPFLKELSLSKTVCLPYSLKEKRDLICVKVKSWERILKDEHGVPAPEIEEIIEENKIEIALVPAIAFDLFGNRIGYGYGYYDRFLPKLKKALKIGVVFDFQILDEIKNSKGARIDIIVSDRRIINAKRI